MTWSRVLAIVSALVATAGLLVFGWSPNTVLVLFWVETAVLMLTPWLVVVVLSLFAPAARPDRWTGLLVGLLPLVVLGGLLATRAFLILLLGALQSIPGGEGLAMLHFVLGLGAVLIAVLQLPAAGALLLVAVKLALDLQRARSATSVPTRAPNRGAA